MKEYKRGKQIVDPSIKAFTENYRKLQAVVSKWQKENGEQWAKRLVPNSTVPFFPADGIPEAPVLELTNRLMESKGRPLSAEQFKSVWESYYSGQHVEDSELLSLFQLALNGVLELARKYMPDDCQQIATDHESQCCPVCGQEASLAILTPPVGKRYHHCTRCGQEWKAKRVGCVYCGNQETKGQTYLRSEDYPGVEFIICHTCGEGLKEFDLRTRSVDDFVLEDIRTLPLNYAAEKWQSEQIATRQSLH